MSIGQVAPKQHEEKREKSPKTNNQSPKQICEQQQ